MTYPVANLDRVIARVCEMLDLRAVLTERYGVALDVRGERWQGACPLPSTVAGFAGSCAEQDASSLGTDAPANLWVSPGERSLVWRCHSCGRHGDVVDLIGYVDGHSRRGVQVGLGAVRRAAELAGLGWMMDGCDGPRLGRDVRSDLLAMTEPLSTVLRSAPSVPALYAFGLNAYVRKLWSANLRAADSQAAEVRAELARRGVTPDQIKRHGLGWARAGGQVARQLGALEGDPLQVAEQLGLVKRNATTGTWYDAQRARIVFPYAELAPDGTIRVTGFAGRYFATSTSQPKPGHADPPKWLNSATVPGVWSKKAALLGLLTAPALARAYGSPMRCVVSEGGYDMLAWERAGIPCVSPVGTDFTIQHATVLQRLGFTALTFAFDGDESGRKAVPTALAGALAAGFGPDDLHVIDLADGLDPDDLDHDTAQRLYDCPLSITEFVIARATLFTEHAEQVLPMLAYLPESDRAELCAALQISPTRVRSNPSIGIDATPGQLVVRAVLAHANACAHLAADEVRNLLADELHLLALLRSVTFGEHTDEAALPVALRRALLGAKLQRDEQAKTEVEALDLWRYGQSMDGFRRAVAERDAAAQRYFDTKKALASLDASHDSA